MPIFEFSLVGVGVVAYKILKAWLDTRDFEPCKTRIAKVRASKNDHLRRQKVALHRMSNGAFEVNPIDL